MSATPLPNQATHETGLVLAGTCGYQIQDHQVVITIPEINNNRNNGNISGTLSVELWAFKQPYNGGECVGHNLAATSIGELYDQYFLANCDYLLDFKAPSEGTWYVSLVLREWDGNDYVTRDFVNFELPYIVDERPTIIRTDESNVISVSFDNKKTIAKKTAGKKPTDDIAQHSTQGLLALNEASVEDIAALKGVSKKLAGNIVAARPFTALEALLNVKGMGPKLLENIKKFITL